ARLRRQLQYFEHGKGGRSVHGVSLWQGLFETDFRALHDFRPQRTFFFDARAKRVRSVDDGLGAEIDELPAYFRQRNDGGDIALRFRDDVLRGARGRDESEPYIGIEA